MTAEDVINRAWRRRHFLVGFIGLITYLFLDGGIAHAEPRALFDDVQGQSLSELGHRLADLRARRVKVNVSSIAGADLPEGADAIDLNLFPDVILQAVKSRFQRRDVRRFTWTGKVSDDPLSMVVIVGGDGPTYGSIFAHGKHYALRGSDAENQEVVEIDQSAFPPEGCDKIPLGAPAGPTAPPLPVISEPPATTATTIDVLVVYTPAARIAEGGSAAMTAMIDLAVAETNASYANSGILPKLNAVQVEEVPYTESGNWDTDLDRLKGTSDGFMDNVHLLRDAYCADVVVLIVGSGEYCGQASLPIMATASSAFALVKYDCATAGYYSFGHEIGHLQGARHDRYVDATNGPNYTYNHGHIDLTLRQRTVMAYRDQCLATAPFTGCPRIPYWSNPNVSYPGYPSNPTGSTTYENNALVLNNTANTVANFRRACRLPDTDQRKCYQAVEPYSVISCAGTGQDGAYVQNPLSYTDNGDGTVTDNNTGLVWQKEGNGQTYTWDQAINACGSFGRLPSKKELMSIVDYAVPYPGPAIHPVFTNTKASFYWSSTTYAYYPNLAWYVFFYYGYVGSGHKSYASYVRCVRGGQSGSFGNLRVTINAGVPDAAEKPLTVGRFVVTRTGPTAAALTVFYTVSGTATVGTDYQALSGSVTITAGQTQAAIAVTPVDDTVDEADETVIVSLSTNAAYTMDSPSIATVTIVDDDPTPTVQFSAAAANGPESATPAVVGGKLSAASGQTVTVYYATANGTAVAGSDYTPASGTLTFNPGETAKTIAVPITDDSIVERDEMFTMSLSSPVNGSLGAIALYTYTINDNDNDTVGVREVQFDLAASGGLESATPAMIGVNLSAAAGQTVTVHYATTNGTATAGSDYTVTSGMLTFAPGVTSQTITVPIAGDMSPEADETFTVTLTNPVNANLGAINTHTRSIYDAGVPGLAGLNTIAEAVDLPAWTFTSTAGADWWLQPAVTHDGTDAARSGFIADNQASSFQTTGSFGASGTVSFWWKVSSEPAYDVLRFSIDGTVKDAISGEVGWQQKSYSVTAGSHTLKWEYTKNGSGAGGIDAAWVDQVVLPAAQVLWTRGDSGEARLWTGIANRITGGGVLAVTGQASHSAPSGNGGPWEATSFAHVDASTDYVLWSNGDSGQAILAKVDTDASSDSVGDGEPAANLFHSGGASPATQEEPFPMVAQAFLPVRTDRNVCPTGVNILADKANSAEKYNKGVIPGLTGSEWAYVNSPAGDGGPWQATSYSYQDVSIGYVLWSRSDTGQAMLAKIAPGDINLSGTIQLTSWAYLNPPTGVGGPWQATSYTHVDASTGYVLWSRSDTGLAILWKVAPGDVSGTIPVTSWAYLDTPSGVGAHWQATSYTHIDASEGYVLWTRGDSGQAILWKVVPGEVSGTIPVASWEYVSPREGVGGPWRATSYVHGATPGFPAEGSATQP